jgi:BNR repeat-like domain
MTAPPDSILFAAPRPHTRVGTLVERGNILWLPVLAPDSADSRFVLQRLDARSGRAPAVGPSLPGSSCGLVPLRGGGLLLVTVEATAGRRQLMSRRGTEDGRTWEAPVLVSDRQAEPILGTSRPIVLGDGTILVAIVWRDADSTTTVVCHATRNQGTSWSTMGMLQAGDVHHASLAQLDDEQVLMVIDPAGQLESRVSPDMGRTWSESRSLGIAALPSGFAVARSAASKDLAIAWTDPAPDSTVAMPSLQALRVAISNDGGTTWGWPNTLVLWPGRVPVMPTLALDERGLALAFVDATPTWVPEPRDRVVCLVVGQAGLGTPRTVESERAIYGLDPAAARATLRIVCAHTLARPPGPRRLFVEGYFMRTQVAAHTIFDSLPRENPEWFDAGAGLARALDWADELVASQDTTGYWATGYGAVFLADMAAALGIFPALEPYAGDERLARYENAARRFAEALVQDHMLLPSGACGVGWWGTVIPRSRRRASRAPYLVSTALAGIELHAWLYRRSGRTEDRDQALRSLDYTLAQIQPDGSLPLGPRVPGRPREGRMTSASYVHEGWIAADVLLGDADVLARLRTALRPHVDWLLHEQDPDGRWVGESEGEFARTAGILDFLMWYDERCESRPDVRQAVRRAGRLLVDPSQWSTIELFHAGNHHEVQRALAGRALAALSRERFAL